MLGSSPSRNRSEEPSSGLVASRCTLRLAGYALALACLLTAGAAIAYYTAEGQPVDRSFGGNGQRYADATDSWLDAVRSGSMFNRSGSRGRSSKSSSDERSSRDRSSRSAGERSSSRESSRRGEQSSTTAKSRESSQRTIREATDTQSSPAYTSSPKRSQTIRYYSSVPMDVGTYRTMCVRLCDGYYWPVNSSATKREFARDAQVCERSCESPVALHVYRNADQEVEHMVDLKGRAYIELQTAFLYRTGYDQACKCRAHPWEEASRLRHVSYAEADQMQSGSLGKP